MMSRWADLPKELLEMISKRLDSGVDALRFRAVCTSWRCSASLPSFDQEIPPLLLMLPQSNSADAVLLRTTVCRMELVRKDPNSSSLSKSWLVKVGESKYGKLHLLNPLTNQKADAATSLDFLDFKFVRLSKAVFLKWSRRFHVFGINKVVLFPMPASCSNIDEFGMLAIYHEGKLGYWRSGDVHWTLLDDKNFQYDDIIARKDQFYVIDRWGTVSWIHPSLKVIQYCPSLYGCGGQKNLVESCGDLYVVDRYLDGERRTWEYYEDYNDNYFHSSGSRMQIGPKAVYFRVYKLDEERGAWVDVKSLDDRVFVLGMDCSFSISCREFSGGIGNCIYFVDGDDFAVWGSTAGHVFQLEDRSIEKLAVIPEFSEIFWPPNAGSSTSTNLDVYV
ncbi:BINDING PROTEIN putative-RELATED [Salix koriyanagi]|uniref:BINDING PROTEIN putative-RELATED n=1 Tax=Salix koriyanagi TaxID=2511006 RepID=A0A9Q0P6T0_9ROSI|nr:BINDING PROTEIN putative-RELATED [Salix koriyanagi]